MRLQEVYEEAEVAGVTIPIPARIQVCPRVEGALPCFRQTVALTPEPPAHDLESRKEDMFSTHISKSGHNLPPPSLAVELALASDSVIQSIVAFQTLARPASPPPVSRVCRLC